MSKRLKVKGTRSSVVLNTMELRTFDVLISNDEHGRSISIADPKTGLMYSIPFEPIEGYLKRGGKKR